MSDRLREQMLAYATDAVNALSTWAHDHSMVDFDACEERVLEAGRALMATWLGQVASAAGPRTPACPKCGVHSLNAAAMQAAHGEQSLWNAAYATRTAELSRLRPQLAAAAVGVGPGSKQRTSTGVQRWESLLGGLTIFAEAAHLLEVLAGVQVGTETLRTHAEAAGTEPEWEQRAAMAHCRPPTSPRGTMRRWPRRCWLPTASWRAIGNATWTAH